MRRVALIHWKEGEAAERLSKLEAAGAAAEFVTPDGSKGLRVIAEQPPDVIVIDLSRLPSHGKAVGVEFRRRKATRHVPLIFVDGVKERVDAIRALLPDATYTQWDRIQEALRDAKVGLKPAVPDTMAGYSGTPLAKKLGLKSTVLLIGAPEGFVETLGDLPESLTFVKRGAANRVLLWVTSMDELRRAFLPAARRVAEGGGLWVVWPKKTSRLAGDVNENRVRELGLSEGWVDYKVCAVDATWSGLLFAPRRKKG